MFSMEIGEFWELIEAKYENSQEIIHNILSHDTGMRVNVLQTKSLEPLIQQMQYLDINKLKHNVTGWYLYQNGEFYNPNNRLKGNIFDLVEKKEAKRYGKVFEGMNPEPRFNKYYQQKDIQQTTTKREAEQESRNLQNELANTKGEDREYLAKYRVGHGKFKKLLLETTTDIKCRLCGVTNEKFLIASHIKPWAESKEYERTNPNNGLLLCPNHDLLFDRGYIGFDEDGNLLTDPLLDDLSKQFMNVQTMQVTFNEAEKYFLNYHRDNIFQKKYLKTMKTPNT